MGFLFLELMSFSRPAISINLISESLCLLESNCLFYFVQLFLYFLYLHPPSFCRNLSDLKNNCNEKVQMKKLNYKKNYPLYRAPLFQPSKSQVIRNFSINALIDTIKMNLYNAKNSKAPSTLHNQPTQNQG